MFDEGFCAECIVDEVETKLQERGVVLRAIDEQIEGMAYCSSPKLRAATAKVIRRLIRDELGR